MKYIYPVQTPGTLSGQPGLIAFRSSVPCTSSLNLLLRLWKGVVVNAASFFTEMVCKNQYIKRPNYLWVWLWYLWDSFLNYSVVSYYLLAIIDCLLLLIRSPSRICSTGENLVSLSFPYLYIQSTFFPVCFLEPSTIGCLYRHPSHRLNHTSEEPRLYLVYSFLNSQNRAIHVTSISHVPSTCSAAF